MEDTEMHLIRDGRIDGNLGHLTHFLIISPIELLDKKGTENANKKRETSRASFSKKTVVLKQTNIDETLKDRNPLSEIYVDAYIAMFCYSTRKVPCLSKF